MSKKLIILAPSLGGKSTLMRYLREHTDLVIAEMDEEVMNANNDAWPTDNEYKNKVLVPKIVKEIIKRDKVIYLASYVPTNLLIEAKKMGFTICLLELNFDQLKERNKKRIEEENYQDATPWLEMQLDNFQELIKAGVIDKTLDGNLPVEILTERTLELTIPTS